jgi:CheY-like chemotaxis protein
VDDDPVNQTVMQSLLGSAGYALAFAGSGAEALVALAGAAVFPDLLLLDNMMPDMSGWGGRGLVTFEWGARGGLVACLLPDPLLLDNMMPYMSGGV